MNADPQRTARNAPVSDLALMALSMQETYRRAAERIENFGTRARIGDWMRQIEQHVETLTQALGGEDVLPPTHADARRALDAEGSIVDGANDDTTLLQLLKQEENLLAERSLALVETGECGKFVGPVRILGDGARRRRDDIGLALAPRDRGPERAQGRSSR